MNYEINNKVIFWPFEIKIEVNTNDDAINLAKLFNNYEKERSEFDEKIQFIHDEIQGHII